MQSTALSAFPHHVNCHSGSHSTAFARSQPATVFFGGQQEHPFGKGREQIWERAVSYFRCYAYRKMKR